MYLIELNVVKTIIQQAFYFLLTGVQVHKVDINRYLSNFKYAKFPSLYFT